MKRKVTAFVCFLFILFVSIQTIIDIPSLFIIGKTPNENTTPAVSRNPLYLEISNEAGKYERKPQDAKVDQIWKAIPGYNGIKVNVEKSYQKMKKNGTFDKELLVYDQIKPRIHLNDLGSAPIYKGHPDKPMVTFLINVAWGNEYLEKMLPVLKKHQVKATFFLEGKWTKNNPELAKKIVKAGHEIGNHSYNHPDMSKLTKNRIAEQLTSTNSQIKETLGVTVKWFAPPSGSYRQDVVEIASSKGMGTIMWTVDTIDWRKPSPDVLINRVLSKVHNGAMILMHPTASSSRSLESLIIQLKKKGYSLGTVTDLMDETRIIN
ncbi:MULTISPECIES: polysaccharide deacetylase family protein [Bacillus]|uniref:NodB homology domain-containing protein n=1 Tax=Bacillus gobiensis TaxID=1441095 RepID=A0A0M5JF87_9BACI|nr:MULTISPECIES: polysaccharide deacetylase family protein [Bacillus]ALC84119.1 hypothetical protein AM592_05445 [Bacillus gobiensis]MED1095451.1 polysaccharide deacetylase family protein [Bacillus capparidis]